VLPDAQQSVLVGHDTSKSGPVPVGTFSDLHVVPPLVVATTAPAPDGVSPTAQQSALVGHDTSSRKR
jgi:hypothetical protein